MRRALTAALLYFAATFAAGFALGTVRTLLVAPRLGETNAVLVEAPIMLLVAWLACGWALRRAELPGRAGARLAMGALAFLFLIAAETILGTLLLGRTFAEQFATYREANAQIGLAAQIAYGAFPVLRR